MALAKRVIPCLDVEGGRVVKGVKFQDLQDAGDPVEAAKRYGEEGADEVVFLDISASVEERGTTLDVVAVTADQLFIPLTVGGGVRTVDDFAATLRAGADKVAVNTAAVERPGLVTEASETFGAQCVVVAIDAKREDDEAGDEADDESPAWSVYTHGGRTRRDLDAVEWAKRVEDLGAGEILLTSMDADGTKAGYDNALNRAVSEAVSIPVIASGGCGSVQHMVDAIEEGRADAVLAASIFHYREITVGEVKEALAKRGVEVRP